jgi:hypothetical protein
LPIKWSYVGSVLVVETIGKYQREELVRALIEARTAPQFRPETRVLFDGRTSEADVSVSEIDGRVRFANSVVEMGFSRRIALVVRDTPLWFGMGRMLSLRLESHNIELKVTRDFDEATRWLVGPPSSST